MSAADVTVVIPTRDRRSFLARCLPTVLGQVGVQVEIVVVDDGSRDGTSDWLASLGNRRIRTIAHATPRGVSAARNSGLAAAATEWVGFLDDDDLWAPSKLAMQLEALRRVDGARWACVGQVTLNDKLRVVGGASPPPGLDRPLFPLLGNNTIPGGGSGVIAATELVRSVGGFDERLSLIADWDLWIRLAKEAPAASVDRPLLGYVRHGANMSWNVSHIGDEFEIVDVKYAQLRAECDVWPNTDAWLNWIADAQRQAGRRWPAITADIQAVRSGRTPKPLVRAAVTGISPHAWIALRDRRKSFQLPPEWRAEAEHWLAPIRSASRMSGHWPVSAHRVEPPALATSAPETESGRRRLRIAR